MNSLLLLLRILYLMINKSLIGFYNTQSFSTSYHEFNNYPIIYDLLFLSETWLKPNSKTPYLNNYNQILRIDNNYPNFKSKRNNGGLLLFQNKLSNIKPIKLVTSFIISNALIPKK